MVQSDWNTSPRILLGTLVSAVFTSLFKTVFPFFNMSWKIQLKSSFKTQWKNHCVNVVSLWQNIWHKQLRRRFRLMICWVHRFGLRWSRNTTVEGYEGVKWHLTPTAARGKEGGRERDRDRDKETQRETQRESERAIEKGWGSDTVPKSSILLN